MLSWLPGLPVHWDTIGKDFVVQALALLSYVAAKKIADHWASFRIPGKKGPDGFKKLFAAPDLAAAHVQLYFNPDRNPLQIKTPSEGKRLGRAVQQTIDSLSGGAARRRTFVKVSGIVEVEWTEDARAPPCHDDKRLAKVSIIAAAL
jgi:hypothetical protein